MDNWERFEETKLRVKQAFHSKLKMKNISNRDCENAQQVWNTMEKKTVGCYQYTYLKTDVLMLTDLFDNF